MTVFRRTPVWLVFLLSCLAGAVSGFTCVYGMSQRPPLTLLDVKEADGLAVRNGALEISITIVRRRQCDARADRWLWQDTGLRDGHGVMIRRWVPVPSSASPPTPLNVEVSFILSLPVPSNVTPGAWFYWSRIHDNCSLIPSLSSPPRDSPDVPVMVTETDVSSMALPVPEVLLPLGIRPGATR